MSPLRRQSPKSSSLHLPGDDCFLAGCVSQSRMICGDEQSPGFSPDSRRSSQKFGLDQRAGQPWTWPFARTLSTAASPSGTPQIRQPAEPELFAVTSTAACPVFCAESEHRVCGFLCVPSTQRGCFEHIRPSASYCRASYLFLVVDFSGASALVDAQSNAKATERRSCEHLKS